MFDESKNIRTRLLRAKDIYNVFSRLENKGYSILNEITEKDYLTKVIEKGNVCVKVHFRNTPYRIDGYKQEILYIEY